MERSLGLGEAREKRMHGRRIRDNSKENKLQAKHNKESSTHLDRPKGVERSQGINMAREKACIQKKIRNNLMEK